jgi:type I restriction enzyme, S subunit
MTELTQLEQALDATSIGKWKAYLAYRDSGIEWLGEIPAHWKVRRLKFAVALNTDVLSEDTHPDCLLEYVDIGNVDSNGFILNVQEFRFEDAPSRARRKVRHEDVIISTVRTLSSCNRPY